MRVQRLWWVLQLLRKAERIGANAHEGWLKSRLEDAVKVSREKNDKDLADLLSASSVSNNGVKDDTKHNKHEGMESSSSSTDIDSENGSIHGSPTARQVAAAEILLDDASRE